MKDIKPEISRILEAIEGPEIRKELLETPRRVQRAYEEMFSGYAADIPSLFKSFEQDGTDQIVTLRDIPFWSTCEHHILSFGGRVSIAYLPVEKVIGASKIVRLIEAYSHRLQLQERLGNQIGAAMMEYLQPQGVAVIIDAVHDCMRCRGVKSETSRLVTSVMLGKFRVERTLRLEVLSVLGLR